MTKQKPEKPRWVYRFDNYKRAFQLLREAMDIMDSRPLNNLEKEGVVQRFEYVWELAWNVLRDYLIYEGVALTSGTPKTVIRAAFEADIISNGDAWMDALDSRNKMSHVYSEEKFEDVVQKIHDEYFIIFNELNLFLQEKSLQEGE